MKQTDLIIEPLSASFTITRTRLSFALDETLLQQIETFWQSECARRGKALFNGRLFCIETISSDATTGDFIEYKTFLASRKHPEWFAHTLRPLAVSGIIRAQDQVLIGRRSMRLTNYPGYWEFVPSGGVDDSVVNGDHVDARAQLVTEFCEETGLKAEQIESIRFFSRMEDKGSGAVDLCAEIILPEAFAITQANPDEYVSLTWQPNTHVEDFLKEKGPQVVPTTWAIWNAFKNGI